MTHAMLSWQTSVLGFFGANKAKSVCRSSVLQFSTQQWARPFTAGVSWLSHSSSDSSLGEESLRRTSAGAEFRSLTVWGKKENL